MRPADGKCNYCHFYEWKKTRRRRLRTRSKSHRVAHMGGSPSLRLLGHPMNFCTALLFHPAFAKRNCLERPLLHFSICCFIKFLKRRGGGSFKKTKVSASVPKQPNHSFKAPEQPHSIDFIMFSQNKFSFLVPLLHLEASSTHVVLSHPPILTPGR